MKTPYETALSVGTTKKWDDYREVYDQLTIEDLIKINTAWDSILPLQNHADTAIVIEVLKKIKSKLRVVELGCYRGLLAQKSIASLPDNIESWVGYDINHKAIEYGEKHNKNSKYVGVKQTQWFWDTEIGVPNAFVSTHTLEHFRWEQFKKVLLHVSDCDWIVLELPITHNNWRGYRGSHVLEASVEDIKNFLSSYSQFYNHQKKGIWVGGFAKK